MLGLAHLNYAYADSDAAKLAWHFGWYEYHKQHAARMRRIIQVPGTMDNESIAYACRRAAAENLLKVRAICRRIQKARSANG